MRTRVRVQENRYDLLKRSLYKNNAQHLNHIRWKNRVFKIRKGLKEITNYALVSMILGGIAYTIAYTIVTTLTNSI